MVKLIVLGSSSSQSFPRKGHNDIICTLARRGGKEKRKRSSLAITTKEGSILIDAGPDILYQLKKFKVKPDAVFITHNHTDAIGGLSCLSGVKVYGKKAKIFGVNIIPFPVFHSRKVKTYGFRILVGKKKIAYVSDLASLTGIKKWIRDCDVVFADGSILNQNMPTHLSIVAQLRTYKKWRIRKVIFTHIGHKTLPHLELTKYCQSIYPPTDIAYDGLQMALA